MLEKTVAELSKALHLREVSSVELTRAYLERIAMVNKELNTYITVCEELAIAQAEKADRRIASGDQNPLVGIPLAHKDIFCTKCHSWRSKKLLETFQDYCMNLS